MLNLGFCFKTVFRHILIYSQIRKPDLENTAGIITAQPVLGSGPASQTRSRFRRLAQKKGGHAWVISKTIQGKITTRIS
jgi:hypothetical protein